MCRLLGWAAATPRSASGLLGDALGGFTELSVRHADGWGAALTDGTRTGPLSSVVKEAVPARESALFASTMTVPATAAAVHLRWATPGMTTAAGNTHPFLREGVAFAHNGEVKDEGRLAPLTDTDLLDSREGDTDSERYFLAVLTELRRGAAPAEALASVIRSVRGTRTTSFNCLLLTPETLVAVCAHDPAFLPPDEVPDYFHLGAERVLAADGSTEAVVVGSTGVLPPPGGSVVPLHEGWVSGAVGGRTEVPNGSVLVVDRATLATDLHPLDG
jgi:predicted glutamine amidotransferase